MYLFHVSIYTTRPCRGGSCFSHDIIWCIGREQLCGVGGDLFVVLEGRDVVKKFHNVASGIFSFCFAVPSFAARGVSLPGAFELGCGLVWLHGVPPAIWMVGFCFRACLPPTVWIVGLF